jgi:probable rRNA maturation factor
MTVIETDTLSISSNGTIPSMPFLALKDKILGKRYSLSIAFVTPKKAQTINMQTRNKDYIPNTLSFELSKNSGEIILCTSVMKKQYKDFDMTYEKYLLYIVIHSMLHLKGMAHGSTMEAKEKQLLSLFTSTNEKTNN